MRVQGRGAAPPKAFNLSANLQYTDSASGHWIARKAFFVGKFRLREVFFVGNLGLTPPKICLSNAPVAQFSGVAEFFRKFTFLIPATNSPIIIDSQRV